MQYFFTVNDIRIAYTKLGSGQPVVLLHGFGEDSTVWHKQVAELRQQFLVIIPDLPGSGQSQVMNKTSGVVTIEDYADCIHAILQHEELKDYIVLGHSMGGYITLAYAEKYAAELKGFGLLHSSAFADSAEKKETRLKGIELIKQYGGASFLKNTIPNLFAAPFKQTNNNDIQQLIDKARLFSNDALVQYYHAMIDRPDRTAVLKNSRVPVLFIIGTDDVAAPMNDVLQQVSLPNVAYVNILENVGHMGMWEDSDRFNGLLLQYLSDVHS